MNKIPSDVMMKLYLKRAGQDLRKSLRKEVQEDTKGILKKMFDIPPCIQHLRHETIKEGSRDNALFSLASHLKHIHGYKGLMDELEEWIARHDYFLTQEQLKAKVNGWLKTPAKTRCGYNKNLMEDIGMKNICEGCGFK